MEGFTLIDAGVAVVIIVSAILAYSRGLLRETMAILGWVAAAVLAFVLAPAVQPLVREIPYLGDFLGDSCELSVIASFAAVFAVVLVLASLFTPLFSSFVRNSALGGVDQGMGFFFGVARGILLVAIALLVFDRAVPPGSVPMVEQSRSAAVFAQLSGNLDEAVPDDAPNWLVERYEELVSVCN
ncbi:MAG: CvpA family protein [Rhodobacteraceae bacterium]|nr:MAG: CvpA family protein [Paracoccaceae bacterium]